VSDVPEMMVIQDALLDAVQAHEDPAVTVTEPIDPAAGADTLAKSIE
jgi:hypothetical protein